MRVFLAAVLGIVLPAAAFAQADPKTAMLERAGFEALDAGDVDAAIIALRGAVASDPNDARLHLGLGAAAYAQQRDDDAKAELERAIALAPSLDQAHELLGLVLHRQGDLADAIRTYDEWLASAPHGAVAARAAGTLAGWRRERALSDEMQQTLGDHFTVSFEGPAEADLAAKAVDSLERAYWRIGPLLGVYPPRAVPVVLYTSQQFQDVTRSPAWAAGSYDGIIRVPMRGALEQPEELDRVLAHEFTHALVHTLSPRAIPTWLNEGLAGALEGRDMSWADRGAAGMPIPLPSLAASFGRLNGQQAAVAYAESAVAVQRLLDDIGGTGVANLIRDLGDGASLDAAFLRRAQENFSDFAARLSP